MIWFIDDDAGSTLHGMEFRHYYMAKVFQKESIQSLIISASYSHLFYHLPLMRNKTYLYEKVNKLDYLWLKVIKYGESNNKKRILKWFQFGWRLLMLPKIVISKPNIIVFSCNAPFLFFPCYYLAKRYKATLVLQVKDIWPLTLMELGGYSKYNPLIYIMQKSINFAIKKADIVVSVLPHFDKYIEEQGIENITVKYLPNGISTQEIENNKTTLNIKTKLKIPKDKFIIGYAGAMGKGDRLDLLLYMTDLLKKYKNIHVVLIGKGEEKNKLENIVKKLNLKNVTILNPIPKRAVHNLLKYFDVCYLGWQDKKLYKYGISANKIFDYMYAKKPILHLYSGDGDLISSSGCGITVTEQSAKNLSQALLKLYFLSEKERNVMGHKGYLYVKKYHCYDSISKTFLTYFQEESSLSLS